MGLSEEPGRLLLSPAIITGCRHPGGQAGGSGSGGAVLGWQCSPLAQRCRWASSPFPPLHCSWSAGSSVESLLVFI